MSFHFSLGVRKTTPLIRTCSSRIDIGNYAKQQRISKPTPISTINTKSEFSIFSSKRHYHKNEIVNKPSPSDENQSTLSSSLPLSSVVENKSGKTTFLNNKTRNMSIHSLNNTKVSSLSSTVKHRQSQRQYSHGERSNGSLQQPAGPLYNQKHSSGANNCTSSSGGGDDDDDGPENATVIKPNHSDYHSDFFIPEVPLHSQDGRKRKRVLVLCTGGTLTMAPDPTKNGALSPVQGAVTNYMTHMTELDNDNMPEVIVHEYNPFYDSSDLGPSEWAVLASDIYDNYYHFDGFVVLMGTDTMAYAATALSFMLENLNKPVIFTGSQIPLSEPYNDARRNLIMALIFASRDTISEVGIFFHDRLIRGCRATKVNTHKLLAFDSPNLDPLATIGITIDENEHLSLPRARGALRVHNEMDTRLLTLRLVPGFDDEVIKHLIESSNSSNVKEKALKVLVLQLYGTGNAPSVKKSFVQLLADAVDNGIMVVANTQCHTGSVLLGHYATGVALAEAGVVSGNDMTLEAISCKAAYLLGRGDLSMKEASQLMGVSLRGEVTPSESLSPPPLASTYQRASRKGRTFY